MSFWLYQGDCRALMAQFQPNSIDAVICDPPYELGFMAKGWDKSGVAFDLITWQWALHLLKPGGYLVAFGGTRKFHRLMCAIEDAGFQIRDTLAWFYFNGFPKSQNYGGGYGTALKPMYEPIVLARKLPEGNVASNIAVYGVGAMNIDATRIPVTDAEYARNHSGDRGHGGTRGADEEGATNFHPGGGNASKIGRWPPNVVLDEFAGAMLDEMVGEVGAHSQVTGDEPSIASEGLVTNIRARVPGAFHGDKGGPSRFFYCPKTSRAERDFGCEHLPIHTGGEATDREDDSAGTNSPRAGAGRTGGVRNRHPTLKPVSLLRWLTRLVSPPRGLVLDPFCGAGSGGMAARLEGMGYIGLEMEAEYLTYAHARIGAVEAGRWTEAA